MPNSSDTPFEPIRRYGPDPIGSYYNGGGMTPGLFFRRHFRQDPREPQPPIAPAILAKLDPRLYFQVGGAIEFPRPRADMLLPEDAPGDIASPADLLARFDATPPLAEDVYAEFKVTLPTDRPAAAAFEMVRAWAMQHFCIKRLVAVIMVHHRPGLGGSSRMDHIHLYVPVRQLGRNGFVGPAPYLCCDIGHREAYDAWTTFQAVQSVKA